MVRATVAVVGVDGCPSGWVAVIEQPSERIRAVVCESFDDLLKDCPGTSVIAVDIPIGLPECGPRDCDVEARQRLGIRRSCVFPAPLRAVLNAQTHREASQIRYALEEKRMSCQAFGILKKVREVDRILIQRPVLQKRLLEVHPELSFAVWQGQPMLYPKRKADGRAERRRLISDTWPGAVERCEASIKRRACGLDDLYDAFAALWSARRAASGMAIQLPKSTVADACGLLMRIVA